MTDISDIVEGKDMPDDHIPWQIDISGLIDEICNASLKMTQSYIGKPWGEAKNRRNESLERLRGRVERGFERYIHEHHSEYGPFNISPGDYEVIVVPSLEEVDKRKTPITPEELHAKITTGRLIKGRPKEPVEDATKIFGDFVEGYKPLRVEVYMESSMFERIKKGEIYCSRTIWP